MRSLRDPSSHAFLLAGGKRKRHGEARKQEAALRPSAEHSSRDLGTPPALEDPDLQRVTRNMVGRFEKSIPASKAIIVFRITIGAGRHVR